MEACCICLEWIEETSMHSIVCGHVLHKHCYAGLSAYAHRMNNALTCPMCRHCICDKHVIYDDDDRDDALTACGLFGQILYFTGVAGMVLMLALTLD